MQLALSPKHFAAALVVSITTTVFAAENERQSIEVSTLGPQIGESVPDFNLADQNGNYHTLESVMGPNGAMLLFHRSADW